MTLSEFVALIKREGQTGTTGDTSDRVTIDVIQIINKHLFKIWRKWPWDWSAEDISITLTADEDDYVVTDSSGSPSTIGQISELYVSGQNDRLRHITRKNYLEWVQDADARGTPTKYIKLGRNASGIGNLKIRISPTPDSAGTILGWGKRRLTALTVADIAAGTAIPFIPTEAHDVLFNFVLADVLSMNNQAVRGTELKLLAKNELAELIESEEAQPDEDVEAPPPDYIKWKLRNRGGSSVV